MDFVTDIEKYHHFWVQKVQPSTETKLWGMDLGEGDIEKYKGPVAFISAADRWEGQDVWFGWGHVHSRGFYRTTISDEPVRYLEPPFLISTDPAIRFIRSQQVHFVTDADWEMLHDDKIPVEDFMVCRPEWIGRLRVDKRVSRTQGELWIFSDREDISVMPGMPLHFADGPSEIFVTVAEA